MKKLSFVINDDLINGPSLAQLRLSKAFAQRGYHVDILFLKRYYKYSLNRYKIKNLRFINFNKNRSLELILPLAWYLFKKKPNIVFSAGDHLNLVSIISCLISFSKCKLSLSSRVSPYDTYKNKSKSVFNSFFKSRLLYFLFKYLNWRADLLSCVSKDMVKQYKKIFKIHKHICIYNIISNSRISRSVSRNNERSDTYGKKKISIIAAGKLAPWKGFHDLICSFALVKKKYSVNLTILGDGEEKTNLKNLVNKLGLNTCVRMPGYVENPLEYFARSNIFVLSSYIEGMPNVLIEAISCGCTPVASRCKTGPEEIIKNGVNGYLYPVGNIKKLSNQIVAAINKPIKKNILKKSVKLFNEEVIINKYKKLLNI